MTLAEYQAAYDAAVADLAAADAAREIAAVNARNAAKVLRAARLAAINRRNE